MPKRHTKARGGILFLTVLLIAAVAWTQVRPLADPAPTVSLQVPSATAKTVDLPWPSYGQAAFGTAGYGVIATHGEQKAVPTASLAKVITALAVLRQYPLRSGESGPTITITQADIDTYNRYVAEDGSVVSVNLGEKITERQALQALLLPSANNMADTLARWAFGSISAYTDYANAYAKSLGLTSVKVTDPSGLAATTVASARDMTVIGQLAMLNPTFAEIVGQTSATIPVEGTIRNYNALLGDDGNVGIKTGNNDENKGAFLFATTVTVGDEKITVVGAVMDGPDLSTVLRDSNRLAMAASREFSMTTFLRRGQPVANYTLPDGRTVSATARDDLTVLTWNGASNKLETDIRALPIGSSANSTVGTVSLRTSVSDARSSVSVRTATSATTPSRLWRLTHPF